MTRERAIAGFILGPGVLAWFLLTGSLRSDLGFITDDWIFIFNRMDGGLDSLTEPHAEHIVLLFVVVFRAFVEVFGISSAVPFHLFSMLMLVAAAAALYFYLRVQVGVIAAAIGAVLILFMGAGYDDLLWIFQTCFSISIATGLAALICLRRETRNHDIAACVLLTVSVLTVTLGLPFLAGVGVLLALSPDRWRRCWVVLVPLALFLAWYVGWGMDAESRMSLDNLVHAPVYIFNAFAYSLGVMTGLFRVEGAVGEWAPRVLAVLVVAAIAFRARSRRCIPPELLIAVAVGLAFWGLAGLNQIPGLEQRNFDQSRYQIPNVVITLMILAGGLVGVRLRARSLAAIGAVAAIGIGVNLGALDEGYERTVRPLSDSAYMSLTALDLLGEDSVEADFEVTVDSWGFQRVTAARYFETAGRFGEAGLSRAELAEASETVRSGVDRVLAEANPIVVAGSGSVRGRGCRRLGKLSGDLSDPVRLSRPVVVIAPTGYSLAAGRFGDGGSVELAGPESGPATLIPPKDGVSPDWNVFVRGEGIARVCSRD